MYVYYIIHSLANNSYTIYTKKIDRDHDNVYLQLKSSKFDILSQW